MHRPGKHWRLLAQDDKDRREAHSGPEFDELVVDGWLHIERMDDNTWWMRLGPLYVTVILKPDGTTRIWMRRDYPAKARVTIDGDVNGKTDGPAWWRSEREEARD